MKCVDDVAETKQGPNVSNNAVDQKLNDLKQETMMWQKPSKDLMSQATLSIRSLMAKQELDIVKQEVNTLKHGTEVDCGGANQDVIKNSEKQQNSELRA